MPPWRKPAKRSTVKVILDANILVSAAFGGVPARATARAFREEVWTCPEINQELLALGRHLPKRLSQQQLSIWNSALLPLISRMKIGQAGRRLSLSRDPKDDIYLSLARAVPADFLVTGDKDLLSIRKEKLEPVGLGNLGVVTPREFLSRVEP